MFRESLLKALEQVHSNSIGEAKMTCHDSLPYTEDKKNRVLVNEGGVVLVQEARTGL